MQPGENGQGAVGLDEGIDEALFDFSVMLLEDLGSGQVHPTEFYQGRFPGYEEEIAKEYSAICHVRPTELQGSIDLMEPDARFLGDLRIGNYLLKRELGRGGQATVYAAQDLRMDRTVALKVLSTTFGRVPPERMERFRREASAVANIDHPCICDVFEADFESEPPYIAMRLVRGDSIRQHIQRAMLIQIGQLDAEHDPHLPCFPKGEEELFTILRVFERLAGALHAAHEDNVIHRDIKPANVIIDESGTPIILDFGLARVGGDESSTLTMTGEVFGTPAYMPPELLRGQVLEPGPTLDVYALAITLYECLTLKRPFDAGTPEAVYKQILEDEVPSVREFHPELPSEVAVVIATALEKDLRRRYATALDFAEELRRICEHEPIIAIPAGPGLRLKRWLQRHPALGTSIAGSVLILVVGLTISLVLLGRVAEERNRRQEVVDRYDSLVGNVEAVFYREEARKKLKVDPVHALLLATEAYRVDPIELNHREVRRAMGSVHEVAREQLPLHRNEIGMGFVQEVAPHPTEPWIVYNDVHNTLRIHDIDSKVTREIIGAVGEIDGMRIAYDEDGTNLFVSRSHGGDIRRHRADIIEVWTPDAGELRFTLSVEGEQLTLRDQGSTRILTSCTDGSLRTWDSQTGALVHEMEREGQVLSWAALSPSEGQFAVGLSPGGGGPSWVEVWDIRADRRVAQLAESVAEIRGGVWSPSGDRLLAFSDDGASLWSLPDAELVAGLEHEAECRSGLFASDGAFLVTIAGAGEVRVWDGQTGEALHQLVGHEERAIIAASFCRRAGKLLATTSYDQTTRVWDVESGEMVRVMRGLRSRATATWWDRESERLMCLAEKGLLHTWNLDEPPWPRVLSSAAGEVRGAWFAQGGERVVVETNTGGVDVLDWRTGESVTSHAWSVPDVVVTHVDDVRSVVLASTSGEPRMLEWSWETGTERGVSGAGPAVMEVLSFGEGDSRYLLLTEAGEVEAWDTDTDERLFTIVPAKELGSSPQTLVSASGRLVATGAADGYVRIWSAADGELLHELGSFKSENGDMRITALAFSRDEESIFAACGDAHIRQWAILTGELLAEARSHTANQLIHLDEAHLLLSAQYRGILVLFDMRRKWSTLTGLPAAESRVQFTIGNRSASPIVVSPDGGTILFADGISPVRLLDVHNLMPAHADSGRVIRGSFSLDPRVEEQTAHLERAIFSPDGALVLAVGGGRAWIWPTEIVPAAEEVSPVGIEFFGGFPSLGLSEDSVK